MSAPNILPFRRYPNLRNSAIHQKIFDAAIDIFVELGYSQASTKQIAERAGISVGSIYRFYPNKFAIFNAVASFYSSGFERTVIDFLQSEDSEKPWPERVDLFLDRLAEFYIENPKLAFAWGTLAGAPEISEHECRFNEWGIKVLEDYLPTVIPNRSPAEYSRISTIIYWSTLSIFERSMPENLELDREIVDQIKIMIKAYVGAVVAKPKDVSPPGST